jgi:hypothetical protein
VAEVSGVLTQLLGQQPSIVGMGGGSDAVLVAPLHVVMVPVTAHLAWQAVPCRVSCVQALGLVHVVGQLPSQSSPVSTMLLPHTGLQSLSVLLLHPPPLGQQPSPLAQVVMAVWVHATLHWPAVPVVPSAVQALLSSQLNAEQLAPSQVSPVSTTPLPQTGLQSLSLLALQPGAQQPSPLAQAVIAVFVQAALQAAALPVRVSVVQAMPSLQLVGQLAPSHFSGASTIPLPQTGLQSLSLLALQPGAQQPSPPVQAVIAVWPHWTLHLLAEPDRTSTVQALLSSQLVGQLPSHVSPASTTLLPQVDEQSLSLPELHPDGQQPSPPVHAEMGEWLHTASHVLAAPVSVSFVQLSPSEHEAGQLPSHFSVPSTTPLPQTAVQSLSFVALQPGAQQPSPTVHAVMGAFTHCALQVTALPIIESAVQAFPSLQVEGQLEPSHSSPGSTIPFPHTALQSVSFEELQPGAQQPSPLVHAVMGAWLHAASHVAALPDIVSVVQAFASSQLVGQFPSHFSPASVMKLPHSTGQSLSTRELQPGAQQPSPLLQVLIATFVQATSQVATLPVMVSVVQALPSSQLVLQFVSQVSPFSTAPLPHEGVQSLSLFALHPAGQHPSPSLQATMGVLEHWKLQVAALPAGRSVVHLLLSSQLVGQLPSQVSPGSTTPLPQVAEQSLSFALVHAPLPQQPSPSMHAVTGVWTQTASQVLASPVSSSFVHGMPSSQLTGQFPSHVSPPSTFPSPHTTVQSMSVATPHDCGQQPSDVVSEHVVTVLQSTVCPPSAPPLDPPLPMEPSGPIEPPPEPGVPPADASGPIPPEPLLPLLPPLLLPPLPTVKPPEPPTKPPPEPPLAVLPPPLPLWPCPPLDVSPLEPPVP